MSDPDKEISKVGGSADDEDDEGGVGGDGVHANSDRDDHRKIQRSTSYVDEYGCGGTRNFTKAKKLVLFPFTKAKKYLLPRRKTLNSRPSSSSSSSSDAAVDAPNESISLPGNISNGNRGVDVCFCFTQPLTLESSSVESKTSDPNDPSFTYDMLKALIEKNDFYSKECNPHLDINDLSFCANITG